MGFHSRVRSRRAVTALGALTAVAFFSWSCSRTGLELYGARAEGDVTGGGDAATMVYDASAPPPSAFADAAVPPPPTSTTPVPPGHPTVPGCTPREEICNGEDDDCDGEIDDIPPVACPGGGSRYCVAGRMSECPTRCETCMPGSERVCFLSYCTYWGVQTCAADGRGWGRCREAQVPPECEPVIDRHKNSPELERCCLDNGYCCVDEFDLDDDGNSRELLGRCDDVLCQ